MYNSSSNNKRAVLILILATVIDREVTITKTSFWALMTKKNLLMWYDFCL